MESPIGWLADWMFFEAESWFKHQIQVFFSEWLVYALTYGCFRGQYFSNPVSSAYGLVFYGKDILGCPMIIHVFYQPKKAVSKQQLETVVAKWARKLTHPRGLISLLTLNWFSEITATSIDELTFQRQDPVYKSQTRAKS